MPDQAALVRPAGVLALTALPAARRRGRRRRLHPPGPGGGGSGDPLRRDRAGDDLAADLLRVHRLHRGVPDGAAQLPLRDRGSGRDVGARAPACSPSPNRIHQTPTIRRMSSTTPTFSTMARSRSCSSIRGQKALPAGTRRAGGSPAMRRRPGSCRGARRRIAAARPGGPCWSANSATSTKSRLPAASRANRGRRPGITSPDIPARPPSSDTPPGLSRRGSCPVPAGTGRDAAPAPIGNGIRPGREAPTKRPPALRPAVRTRLTLRAGRQPNRTRKRVGAVRTG